MTLKIKLRTISFEYAFVVVVKIKINARRMNSFLLHLLSFILLRNEVHAKNTEELYIQLKHQGPRCM